MVINKKQISKNSISEKKKKKIENGFKSKIRNEIEGIDDSQSSKFVVDSPNLNQEYNKISNSSNLDIKEARREILNEIKSKTLRTEEEKKPFILGFNKSRTFLRGIGSRRKELIDSPSSSQQATEDSRKVWDKKKKTQEKALTQKLKVKKNKLQKNVKISDIKIKLRSVAKKGLPSQTSQKILDQPKSLKVDYEAQFKVVLSTFFILIFILFTIAIAGLYLGRWQGPWLVKLTEIIPLPAGYVNGQSIAANTFLNDAEVLENFIERQNQKVSDQEVRQQTMDKLIEFEVVRQIAEETNISLTKSEIKSQLPELLEGDDDSKTNLLTHELYGWDFDTYLEKVIKPLLLRLKVEEQFYKTDGGSYVKKTMVGLYQLISDDESRFYEVAAEVNQDNSFASRGDLGWLKLGETSPEFELQLLNLDEGEISQVVETRYGYHIIKLEEKIVSDDGSLFHASHIFMARPSFENYLEEQIKKATIVTLIRI